MKKLIALIAFLAIQGTSLTFAQSSNVQSIHNYKRPALKTSKKNQTTSYVIERSPNTMNSMSNYKKPHFFNPISVSLLPTITTSGIGASHYNYKRPRSKVLTKITVSNISLRDTSENNVKNEEVEIRNSNI